MYVRLITLARGCGASENTCSPSALGPERVTIANDWLEAGNEEAERAQDEKVDDGDCEPELEPDARGDSTQETSSAAAGAAGVVGFVGGSLGEER